jgi:hypothetical protein
MMRSLGATTVSVRASGGCQKTVRQIILVMMELHSSVTPIIFQSWAIGA